jgi:hypothetical protein
MTRKTKPQKEILMSYLRIINLRALPPAIFLAFAVLSNNPALRAKDVPPDACAMLPATQLAKVLKQSFSPPTKSTAPAAFHDSPTGTDCTYKTGNGLHRTVLFRIYVESSPAAAKETFNKLSIFYGPNKAVAGKWDSAYLDSRHAIHVQKGNVRYYFNLNPIGSDTAKADQQLKDLASSVAGQL